MKVRIIPHWKWNGEPISEVPPIISELSQRDRHIAIGHAVEDALRKAASGHVEARSQEFELRITFED